MKNQTDSLKTAANSSQKASAPPSRSSQKASSKNAFFTGMICLLVLLVMVLAIGQHRARNTLKAGQSYLQAQASKDEMSLVSQFEARHLEQARALLAQSKPSSQTIWPLFSNAMILGDSRALGFQEFDFLPDASVLAEIGYGVKNVEQSLDEIEARQPEVIYVSFGINDVENGIGSGPDEYGQMFEAAIEKICQKAPNSKIVVNSILDVTQAVKDSRPALAHVAEYNQQLAKICQEKGWIFVDNSALEADPAIYEPDGIHFTASFYERWARNMLSQYFNSRLLGS